MSNFREAKEFVNQLYPSQNLTFQTFSKTDSTKARIIHGTLDGCWDQLASLNSQGANTYSMVNLGDLRGRKAENVTTISGVFLDLDGSSLEPVLNSPVPPHAVIESSWGRYNARWALSPLPISGNRTYAKRLFKVLQLAVAEKFDGDSSVCDLARVARLPGQFNHNHGEPFLVRVLMLNNSPVLTLPEFAQALGIDLKKRAYEQSGKGLRNSKGIEVMLHGAPLYEGERNVHLFGMCRKLAYQDILDEELLEIALVLNDHRCDPPLCEEEIRSITNSVSGYWHSNSRDVSEYLERINQKNPDLMFCLGDFYKFSWERREHIRIPGNALVCDIFNFSNFTASRNVINQVLEELAKSTRQGLPPESHLTRFVRECVSEGGRAVLKEVYRAYLEWCRKICLFPVSQAALRHEIENRTGVELKKIKVNGRTPKGFKGICLNG